jgi:sucrose synthase
MLNIVSPGADADVYFPYTENERRLAGLKDELHELIFGGAGENVRGRLERPDRPILFALSRLDKIKNVTGLVEWFARSPRLRELANLMIVAGVSTDPNQSGDEEERHAIGHLHEIMNQHHLDGQMRWIAGRLDKNLSGELYRTIADHRGVFVQPALFEAFGLTVIEAMASGLPTFATCYGGPLEIIEHGVSGFHIDPNHGETAAELLADFLQRCEAEPGYWEQIAGQSIDRVQARYTWKLYASRLMTLSRVYGFWKYVTNLERAETRRYLEMLYGLQFRPRAEMIQS